MTKPRITAHGKQLKMDGRHMADCVNDETAAVIAVCLNHGLLVHASAADREMVERFFA